MAWNGNGYVPPPAFQQQQPQFQNHQKPRGQAQLPFGLPSFQHKSKQQNPPSHGMNSQPAYQKQQINSPAPAIRPPMTSYHAPEKSKNKLIAGALVGLVALILIIAIAAAASGGGGGGDDGRQRLFPAETRSGNNYVGLFLQNEMPDEAFIAFKSAADRWSKIVRGTAISTQIFEPGRNFCGLIFPERVVFDHLIIAAEVSPIDGGGGILGQAGPCGVSGNLPFLGTMTFDSADIANLITDGAVESVILHEMGHVLGIGTLWSRINVLIDPVFQGNQVLVNNQPKMIGTNAVTEYRKLTGNNNEQFVPVEDGTDSSGVDVISPKANGRGSIDGHWDEDFFPGELMEFRINTRGGPPPMSATTIASLADFGYKVDTSQADSFSVSRARAEKLRGGGSGNEYAMINDILDIPLVQFPEHN